MCCKEALATIQLIIMSSYFLEDLCLSVFNFQVKPKRLFVAWYAFQRQKHRYIDTICISVSETPRPGIQS